MEEGARREVIVPGIFRPIICHGYSSDLVRAFGAEAVLALEDVNDPASGVSVSNAGLIEALSLDPDGVKVSLAVVSDSASGFLSIADDVERSLHPVCLNYPQFFTCGAASLEVRIEPVFEFNWSIERFPDWVFWTVFVRGGVRVLPDGFCLSNQAIAAELERRVLSRKEEHRHVS